MSATTEKFEHPSDLVNAVLIAVTALPDGMFFRASTGVARPLGTTRVVRFNLPGTPDILGTFRGRSVGIECKTGTGRLSAVQRTWRKNFLRSGGLYIEARSVQQVLAELGA